MSLDSHTCEQCLARLPKHVIAVGASLPIVSYSFNAARRREMTGREYISDSASGSEGLSRSASEAVSESAS